MSRSLGGWRWPVQRGAWFALAMDRCARYSAGVAHGFDPRNPVGWRVIIAGWLAIGLAWAPAVYLMDPSARGPSAFAEATLLSVASFIPWVAITPLVLAACERVDLERRRAQGLALLLVGMALALPLLALLSRLCSILAARLAGFEIAIGGAEQWVQAVTITALFSVPTALAVVAIGLVLAASRRAAQREWQLANARLAVLRAELNPHFLFNSLGGIAELAHQSPEAAEQAIAALADILRATLAEKRRWRPLSEEVAAVRDHLGLHDALIGGVALDLDVDPAAWQAPVPPHILTPLVENATTHGSAADGNFTLAIAARREGEALMILLTNPCAEVERPSAGLGSGLAHVRERLAMLYGEAASLEAARRGERFEVRLRLPATVAGDEP